MVRTHDRAIAARSASHRHATRALLRSRSSWSPSLRPPMDCITRLPSCTRGGTDRLPHGLLRHLVGVDGLYLVRLGIRLRRRAVSTAGLRADRRGVAPRSRYPDDVRDAHAQHRHCWRLRRHAAGACGPVAAERRHPIPSAGRRHAAMRSVSRCFKPRGSVMLFMPQVLAARIPHVWPHWISALPMWAERASPTTWHPHHIAERYGLLTLIVLGESILSATTPSSRRSPLAMRFQISRRSLSAGC